MNVWNIFCRSHKVPITYVSKYQCKWSLVFLKFHVNPASRSDVLRCSIEDQTQFMILTWYYLYDTIIGNRLSWLNDRRALCHMLQENYYAHMDTRLYDRFILVLSLNLSRSYRYGELFTPNPENFTL